MISEWFWSYYLNEDGLFIFLRLAVLLGIVSFFAAVVYNYVAEKAQYYDDHSDKWLDGLFFGFVVLIVLVASGVFLPGLLGAIFWAFFL